MSPDETKLIPPKPADAGGLKNGANRFARDLEGLTARRRALDLEIVGEKIYRIDALFGSEEFERKGRFAAGQALAELDRLAAKSDFLIGHNLLGFDLPLLRRLYPHLKLLQKPVIDTLYLSPLAFLENPYHRLVKDYKLVKDSLNYPVADARLALPLFHDQWQVFAEAAATDRRQLLALYRYCLQAAHFAAYSHDGGFDALFAALGAPSFPGRCSHPAPVARPPVQGLVLSVLPLDPRFRRSAGALLRVSLFPAVPWRKRQWRQSAAGDRRIRIE